MGRSALATAAALLVLLAGCSEPTAGNPSAGDEPTGTEQTTTEESTESSTEPPSEDNGLAAVQPCDLADESARSGLGLTGGEEKKFGEARVCVFRKEGATLNESYTVQVEIFENRGFADIVASDVQQLPEIGDHSAVRFTGTTGGCAVSLGVTEESRVDATAVGGDPQQGCTVAQQLATAVEPNLP